MNEQKHVPTEAIARKVLATVDAGLVKGLGVRKPGSMCVEAAVCYAFDLPHSDRPPCVGDAVRAYKIRLNDSAWSSDAARTAGMRRVAIAQLGSDEIDQNEFRRLVVVGIVKELLPLAMRAAAKRNPAHAVALEGAAVACEAVTEFSQAREVSLSAQKIADAAAAAYAAAAAAAAYAAADAADAAAYAADADAYAAAAADAAAAAAAAAYAAAYAAADAADAAAYAADAYAYAAARDSVLAKAAEIAVQALIKLGSKGAQWLDLCEAA